MKITYNENPLMTTVELDDHEREILWYKTQAEQMRWMFLDADFHLKEGDDRFDLDRAREAVCMDQFYDETGNNDKPSPLDERIDMIVKDYVEALMGPHVGDCTCVACSCEKCHAEDLLGINTVEGLGKHSAVKIHSAFGEYMRPWKRKRTIHQVIEYLENYDAAKKPPKWDGWEPHVERWNEEAKLALEWLKAYKEKHFS